MNNLCLCSSSQIDPLWRNSNLSPNVLQNRSIFLPKKNFSQIQFVREPIISVQAQQNIVATLSTSIKCKSNYTDGCYAEYNLRSLRRGFGQIRDIRYETMESGKPSLVIHSSTLDKTETDIVLATNAVLQELIKTELRKRFAIVHTEECVYIIGGYIYDPKIPARRKPSHDYKYEVSTRKFLPIQALPNGAINFGLCVDKDLIYAVGGNDIDNKPLNNCYGLTTSKSNEPWIELPNLPAPTSGPGIGVYNGELHCVGGFDIIGSESVTHGEYLTLRYPQENHWKYCPELSITRARPLVLIIPDNSITKQSVYVAGGYDVHRTTHKPYMIPDIQLFNPNKQCWEYLTTIPNLTLLHALSFNDNKLHVSETTELPDQIPDTKILRSFDLKNLVWIEEHENILKKTNEKKDSTLKIPSHLSTDKQKYSNNRDHEKLQIKTSHSPTIKPVSTLKVFNSKSRQNSIHSDSDQKHATSKHLNIPIKQSSIKTKSSITSKSNIPHTSSVSLKKPPSNTQKIPSKNLKIKPAK